MNQSLDASTRIATSTANAATGYATAAVAAYVDLASQMFGCWANAVDTMMGTATEPKSWYRHPDQNRGFTPALAWPWTGWTAAALPGSNGGAFNPMAMWFKAWPLQGNPAAWPMAFALMGFGVSRSVAYPLAEANTAALDAMATAGSAVEQTFARYRSDGGHATAQISYATPVAMAAALPIGLNAMAPWLGLLANSSRSV